MDQNTLKLGDYNCICDVCGFKYKASQMKKRWDGAIVCGPDWETRHPMDFLKSPKEADPLPFTRPEPADQFVSVTYNTSAGNQELTVPSGTFNGTTL